jgi:hypothetical protein
MKPKPSRKNAQCRMRAKQILQGKKKKTHIAVAYRTKTIVHAINQYDAVHKQKHAAVEKEHKNEIMQSTHIAETQEMNNAVHKQKQTVNTVGTEK